MKAEKKAKALGYQDLKEYLEKSQGKSIRAMAGELGIGHVAMSRAICRFMEANNEKAPEVKRRR